MVLCTFETKMAQNKYALTRYKILDRCFRNRGKKYFIEDLIHECSEVLTELGTESGTISHRQILYDIAFMESSAGWEIDLERMHEGKKVYYRYADPRYSISNSPLTDVEISELRSAIQILSQFEGLPQFNWIGEILAKLSCGTDKIMQSVISFDSNEYLVGIEYIGKLYNAVVNKTPLVIEYKPFSFHDSVKYTIHPHFLKQYNNRWFLLGYCEEEKRYTWILAMDRIVSISTADITFKETNVDWNDFFEDIIGVTKYDNETLTTVILRFSQESAHYAETKPLHGSQINKWIDEDTLEVKLSVYPNYELEQTILAFGENVQVIKPERLRTRILEREQRSIENHLRSD